MRILIADDDPVLLELLPPLLRREGHYVHLCDTAGEVAEIAATEGIHLVVLEPDQLPYSLALDLCHTLRRQSATMVLFVSHLGGAAERVKALEAGADDYIVKPFNSNELIARVHALLRRHPVNMFALGAGMMQVTEDLWLDMPGQRLIGGRVELPLVGREFQLLIYLLGHEAVALSREKLLRDVWGPEYEGSAREVDVYIRYLRQKIEPQPSQPRYILTVWGTGYQFRRPASAIPQNVGDFQQFLSMHLSRFVGDL